MRMGNNGDFVKDELRGCRAGGWKYDKHTSSCETMCSSKEEDATRIKFPIAVVIDNGNSYGLMLRDKVVPIFDNLNIKQAESYQVVQYGLSGQYFGEKFPKRAAYEDFKVDLTLRVRFPKNTQMYKGGSFMKQGLADFCEKADPGTIIIATVVEIRGLEERALRETVTNCLIDKKATLFIFAASPFEVDWNHPWNETMEEYRSLARLTGGEFFFHTFATVHMERKIAEKVNVNCDCVLYEIDNSPQPQTPTPQPPPPGKELFKVNVTGGFSVFKVKGGFQVKDANFRVRGEAANGIGQQVNWGGLLTGP